MMLASDMILDTEQLDPDFAWFHGEEGDHVAIPRSDWSVMGMPTKVHVTVGTGG